MNQQQNANPTVKQSMAQKRASHALGKVRELETEAKRTSAKQAYGLYVSYVKALPATIRLNGLGQALAMEKAKAGKHVGHDKLFAHVSDWLLRGWGTSSPWYGKPDIFTAITGGSQDDYLRAHAEALAYLDWLKKFAVAMLVEDKEGDA